MTDTLDQLTDAELSEVFAVEVAGESPVDIRLAKRGDEDWHQQCPLPYATSADAILPHMAEYPFVDCNRDGYRWTVGVGDYETMDAEYADAPTFARAACIALILAKRAEKGAAV